MGIYSNDNIFGIRIYQFNEDDFSETLFQEKSDEIMTREKMREVYLFYTQLKHKNEIFFKIYTECSSTHDVQNKGQFMMWKPISLNRFLEKFGV
jgi:hypothetical protein